MGSVYDCMKTHRLGSVELNSTITRASRLVFGAQTVHSCEKKLAHPFESRIFAIAAGLLAIPESGACALQ